MMHVFGKLRKVLSRCNPARCVHACTRSSDSDKENSCSACKSFGQFLLLYSATFLFVLPLACNQLRNSVYYGQVFHIKSVEERNTLLKANSERLSQARAYLNACDISVLHDLLSASNHYQNRSRIELVIVTQSRNRIGKKLQNHVPFYLTQVVSEWIRLLQEAHQQRFPFRVSATICNVDEDISTYAEAVEMAKYLPVINRFPHKTMSRTLSSRATNVERKNKEKEDFIFCHERLLQRRPEFLLVVEDDSIPHPDFFTVLRHTLEYHVESRYQQGEPTQPEDVDWVKLYHPHYFSHFLAPESERVTEWLALTVVLGTVLTAINQRLLPTPLHIKGNLYVLWLFFGVYSLLLTLVISRPHLMELRRFLAPYLYGYYPAPGCCTPGMLYSYRAARELTGYMRATLHQHRRFARDQVMSRFVEDSPRPIVRYMIQPNLLTHIGFISSVRGSVDASRVESTK